MAGVTAEGCSLDGVLSAWPRLGRKFFVKGVCKTERAVKEQFSVLTTAAAAAWDFQSASLPSPQTSQRQCVQKLQLPHQTHSSCSATTDFHVYAPKLLASRKQKD